MRHAFAGTPTLLRLMMRLDRIKLPLWLLGITFLIGITPFSLRAVIESEAETQGITAEMALAQQAALVENSAASIAMQGPADSVDTFGGRYAFEIGAFTFAIVALMNVLLIVRHTRAEEESGRADLVRATAVGAWSPFAAVGLLAIAVNGYVALMTMAVFAIDGLDPARSLVFGLALALCGGVFAAIALIWVQVFEYGRAAAGASLASIAVAFAIRAVGDVQDSWLSWLSPIGWGQSTDAFGEMHLWPIAALIAGIVVAFGVAISLVQRRDVGAGLIEQRSGPASATSSLLSPLGLAWRLQRSTLLWWTLGVAFLGAVYGASLAEIENFVEEIESMREVLEQMGMTGESLRDGFVSVILSMLALIAGAGVVQSALRARGEELAGRAEPVLAGHVSRRSWMGSHLALAVLATPWLLVVGGVAMSVADAAITGEVDSIGRFAAAAAMRTPALWAIVGIGALLYGLDRRWATGGWAVFAVTVFVSLFGQLVRLPDMALNISPLRHVTHWPETDQGVVGVVVLVVISVVTMLGGLMLFERRDVG